MKLTRLTNTFLVASLLLAFTASTQTQASMNAQARADFQRADADLNKTYQSVLAKLLTVESKQKLREAQRAWVVSRDAEAARTAKEADGGSMAPTLRYETMTHLTQQRIKELKAMLDHRTESEPKSAASSVTPSPASTPESPTEHAQSLSEPELTPSSISSSVCPDKKWEYKPATDNETPRIVKAGTNEIAGELSQDCGDTSAGRATPLWAPDSKRLAISCGNAKLRVVWVYQLQNDRWTSLENPIGEDDQIDERAANIIEAQAKKKGLRKGTFLHLQWSAAEPRQWLDPDTMVLYISMREVVRRNDGEFVNFGYSADLLFTLKFGDTGNWKIVKAHEMTGKAAESPSLSTPLADQVLYRSPQGNYRIQASVDGSALWTVPMNDPSRRKPLRGADPDNRAPEEFSASPNENWLFDNRQHELYRNTDDFAFSVFNRKQWLWKNALDCASKEFHLARRDVDGDSPGWSFDSARMLIHFEAQLQPCFAYFNTRTKAFEQTPYLRMVNTKLHTEKPYEAFPNVAFAGDHLASYVVFAEPIDSPPSEAILKPRLAALDQELQTLREKHLADNATRKDSSVVEFWRSEYDKWNKAVQLYLPFAPDAEKESLKLQFLCDLTQREVNGLREVAPAESPGTPPAQSASPAGPPP